MTGKVYWGCLLPSPEAVGECPAVGEEVWRDAWWYEVRGWQEGAAEVRDTMAHS